MRGPAANWVCSAQHPLGKAADRWTCTSAFHSSSLPSIMANSVPTAPTQPHALMQLCHILLIYCAVQSKQLCIPFQTTGTIRSPKPLQCILHHSQNASLSMHTHVSTTVMPPEMSLAQLERRLTASIFRYSRTQQEAVISPSGGQKDMMLTPAQ